MTWRALTKVLITIGVGLDLPSPLTGALGAGPRVSSVAAAGGTVVFGGGEIEPLVPARLLDTRAGNGAPVGKVGPGSTTILQVAGRGGVLAIGAGAVVLNVVATEPTANGYVTGSTRRVSCGHSPRISTSSRVRPSRIWWSSSLG